MQSLNFNYQDYLDYRLWMNRNFRVKVGSSLVGFSGLVIRFGYQRVERMLCRLILMACHRRLDVVRFRYLGSVVSFYAK